MPLFTLHRNYVLRTTKGRTIQFKKGEPTHVPPICVEDVVSIGAIAVEEGDGDILPDEEEVVVLTQSERRDAIRKAFRVLKARNDRGDFTGNGMPAAKRLQAITGFEVPSKERDKYWQEMKEEEQEALEQAALDANMEAESTTGDD